jgi:3-methylfumaryl-CoA hydratase
MAEDYRPWIGRVEEAEDIISAGQAARMAATLGVAPSGVQAAPDSGPAPLADPWTDGASLPPLWHWMGWTPRAGMDALGPDGHPARGGFLPPVPLPRRMWAGSRIEFHAPLRIGRPMRRRSEILRIADKAGASGPIVLVTLRHAVEGPEGLALTEEQDIVYVALPDCYIPPPPVPAPPAAWSEPVDTSEVRLFRFSALTFNAHRIHFDLPYATGVERYPGLVVHGPLQAMVMMEAARARAGGRFPRRFRFRGLRPAFHHEPLSVRGSSPTAAEMTVATVNGEGSACAEGAIGWA